MHQMFIKMPSFANHILMASYAINPILFRSLPAPRSWSVTGLGGGLINVSLEKIRFSGKIQLAWIVKTSNLSTPTSRTKKSIIASTLYPIKQVGYCLQYIVMHGKSSILGFRVSETTCRLVLSSNSAIPRTYLIYFRERTIKQSKVLSEPSTKTNLWKIFFFGKSSKSSKVMMSK